MNAVQSKYCGGGIIAIYACNLAPHIIAIIWNFNKTLYQKVIIRIKAYVKYSKEYKNKKREEQRIENLEKIKEACPYLEGVNAVVS